VGLCQTGALSMARGGARAADILAHYYAGSSVRKLY
jgi:peptidoglycan hydrolase-like amidase